MLWRIGEILIQKKLLSWEQLESALGEQRRTHRLLGEILIEKGFISASLFYKNLAEQMGIRFVDLKKTRVNPKAIELVPRDLCETHKLFPIETFKDTLVIGIGNPILNYPENQLLELSRLNTIEKVLCDPIQMDAAIEEYYPLQRPHHPTKA